MLGDLFKDNTERGVYRSKDGGRSWERILFANAGAGAVDLTLDPNNPRILYASTWRVRRNPYSLSSGGDGSALWKSTDSGDTWAEISKNEGFPKDTLALLFDGERRARMAAAMRNAAAPDAARKIVVTMLEAVHG